MKAKILEPGGSDGRKTLMGVKRRMTRSGHARKKKEKTAGGNTKGRKKLNKG